MPLIGKSTEVVYIVTIRLPSGDELDVSLKTLNEAMAFIDSHKANTVSQGLDSPVLFLKEHTIFTWSVE